MDIEYNNTSGGVVKSSRASGGATANKLKQFLKPPYVYFIIGGAVLGIFAFFKNKNKTETADDGSNVIYVPTASSTDSAVVDNGSNMYGALQEMMTQNNEALRTSMQSQSAAMTEASQNQAAATNAALQAQNATINSALTSILNNTSKTNGTVDSVQSGSNTVTNANQEYNNQLLAASEISTLKSNYKTKQDYFMSDGKIDASEQSELNAIHSEAERIGINAGFGSGGVDGSGRNIPDSIRKQTGV